MPVAPAAVAAMGDMECGLGRATVRWARGFEAPGAPGEFPDPIGIPRSSRREPSGSIVWTGTTSPTLIVIDCICALWRCG
jgi:hypothetical protein